MTMGSPPAAGLDRAGRLNEALLRHGAPAITTDAIGGINLAMLIDVLRSLGMTMQKCVSNHMGLYHVVFSQQGAKRGDQPTESAAIAASKASAIVDAALAALRIHAP
jgi:hypothetical protein